jgi:hypothetical protein
MKSILITIAISVYMTFMVVTIQVANKQTLATSDVTLDLINVMTLAFEEGGGEGGEWICPPWPNEPEYFDPNNQCLGGIHQCGIIFFLEGVEQASYIYPNYMHDVSYTYQCIPEVIVNP